MGWFSLFGWGTAIAVGALISVGVVLMERPSELRAARISFWMTAVLLWLFAMTWAYRTHYALPVRAAGAAILAAATAFGLVYILDLIHRREVEATSSQSVRAEPTTMDAAEIRELEKVNDFIGGRDEMLLRESFDLPKILSFNIKMVKAMHMPAGPAREAEAREADAFFFAGQSIINVTATNTSFSPFGTPDFHPKHDEVARINTSVSFVNSAAKLTALENNAMLPQDVRQYLTQFHKTLDENMALMIAVLNDRFRADPRTISENDTYGSPYYGSVSNEFWRRFAPLKPRADDVLNAVRARVDILNKGKR